MTAHAISSDMQYAINAQIAVQSFNQNPSQTVDICVGSPAQLGVLYKQNSWRIGVASVYNSRTSTFADPSKLDDLMCSNFESNSDKLMPSQQNGASQPSFQSGLIRHWQNAVDRVFAAHLIAVANMHYKHHKAKCRDCCHKSFVGSDQKLVAKYSSAGSMTPTMPAHFKKLFDQFPFGNRREQI